MVLPISNPTKSYWIEEANSPLRHHRTTPELPRETDVVIIGSGYTGASAAYWLHKFTEGAGHTTPRMLMLEARDVCGGATGRNGGHLRPHAFSSYQAWASQLGSEGALAVIRHEMAHLDAFDKLLREEGITPESVSFKLGKTFDAAMTEEAWASLKDNYFALERDHGTDGEVIRGCKLMGDPEEAQKFTQMKGCCGAISHATGQIWPYKFVHALLSILLNAGKLNLQSDTPVSTVSEPNGDGWIAVKTPRGDVRTKAVLHATNRWASHLLPEFKNLIFPARSVLAALRAPKGTLKNTGAQHWDAGGNIYNYFTQLPPPHNTLIIGGGKLLTAHEPTSHILSDDEDRVHKGIPEYYASWPASSVVGWSGGSQAEFARPLKEGGSWSGIESNTIDNFPYIGPIPDRRGQFISAGYGGHGMPRILLSTAYLAPQILESIGFSYTTPGLVAPYPPFPEAYRATPGRIQILQSVNAASKFSAMIQSHIESSRKPFCRASKL